MQAQDLLKFTSGPADTPRVTPTHPDPLPPRRALIVLALGVMPLVAAFCVLRSLLAMGDLPVDGLIAFGLLAGAALVAVRSEIHLGTMMVGSEWAATLPAAILFPEQAPLIGLAVLATTYPTWRGYVAAGSNEVVTLTLAGLAVNAIAADAAGSGDIGTLALVASVASGVLLLGNVATAWMVIIGLRLSTMREYIALAVLTAAATFLLAAPIVLVLLIAMRSFGSIVIPLVLVPLLAANYFHGLFRRTLEMRDELAEKAQILARTNLQFAAAMVRALDTRDAYTAGHSAAVAVYTRDIAREMGFDDETVRLAHLAGLLHDIGKIGVPGRVLNKQSPLDDEEYELMKTHAAMGADILGEVDLYKDIAILVRYHHERIDGRGYPDKLEGEAIPAISRMISVADTYSAMTTDRPYRDGMPTEKAMSILPECRGTQLDADCTNAFKRILIVADADYQRGKQTDFEVEVAKHQALSEVEAEAVRIHAPTPAGPPAPAAPDVPMLPAAVDGKLVEVDLEREAA
ncbi:MAG: family phosphohydrolase [Thermoleophilia bacterium]|nr:family phosphohydrolase [Thermoleophilia bacterium]